MTHGPIFTWQQVYPAKVQPLSAPEDIARYQWFVRWPDNAPAARRTVEFQSFTIGSPPIVPQVWYPPAIYPDSVPAAKRTVEYPSWTFGFPPIQVWYPPPFWPDYIRSKPRSPDLSLTDQSGPIAPPVVPPAANIGIISLMNSGSYRRYEVVGY